MRLPTIFVSPLASVRSAPGVRVAMVSASVSRSAGGIFFAVRSLSNSLTDEGCRVSVFGGDDENSVLDAATWGAAHVSVHRVLGPSSFSFQPGLMSDLVKGLPNIVHVHGLWTYASVVAARWSAGVQPYMVSPHGMLDAWAIRSSGWRKRVAGLLYERANLRGAACVHALCAAEYRAIRSYGYKGPIAVIPNGVDVPNDISVKAAAQFGEQPLVHGKTVLFLGRIHPKKGLSALLSAWAIVLGRNTNGAKHWNLVIAGWDQGGHLNELMRLAKRLGLENSVAFVGPKFGIEKHRHLQSADAFVLPSLSEGLPLAILEAWSYGVPVLMTPQCNLPEGFTAGAAIRALPEENSLAEGLAALFAMSDTDRLAAGARGRDLAETRFAWKNIGKEMLSVYRWLQHQGPMPNCVHLD